MPRSENWGRGSTRRSRRERLIVLARDPICYLQLPGCTQISTIAEHVVNRAAGGGEDMANKRGACKSCNDHKRISEATAGRRRLNPHREPPPHPGLRSSTQAPRG